MKPYSILCLAAAALGAVSCGHKASQGQLPEPHLAVVQAHIKELPTRMEFVGQTHSLYDVTIQPRVSGYLLSVHYQQGMPVDKGQLLFMLDPNPLQLAVDQANASLYAARSQLVEAQNNYNRSVPLARINAISQSALDQATASLASAKASLRSADAAVRNAKLNLSYATIYSPTEGVIGETIGSVGDYVGPGTNNPVLNTISNIDSIYVYISIPTPRYLAIVERDSLDRPLYDNAGLLTDVEMVLADGTLYPYKGEYKFTERAVNSQTGSVVIRVLFPNPERNLNPGQYVRIHADVGGGTGAVLVPQRAVMQSQGINSLYVVGKDSTVEYREVSLGDTYGTEWGILSGVEPGEMVLTEGLLKVRSGMKVVPVVQLPPKADSVQTANHK